MYIKAFTSMYIQVCTLKHLQVCKCFTINVSDTIHDRYMSSAPIPGIQYLLYIVAEKTVGESVETIRIYKI